LFVKILAQDIIGVMRISLFRQILLKTILVCF